MSVQGARSSLDMSPLRPTRSLTFALLLLALPAVAQRPSRSGIGLKAGLQWSTIQSGGQNMQSIPGAAAGAYAPLWFGNRLEFQPELLLSYQGATHFHKEDPAREIRLLYAQLPVSAKLYLTNAVNVQLGVEAGYLVAANVDGNDAMESYKPFDFGLLGGIGVDMMNGLDITARFYSGLTPILADDIELFPTNRCTQLSVGYRIAQFNRSRHYRRRG